MRMWISFGGAVVYAADGGTGIDFDGTENTFILDAASEFDFFGFSYDPAYTDDSEVVVLEGSVGTGVRTIEFGEFINFPERQASPEEGTFGFTNFVQTVDGSLVSGSIDLYLPPIDGLRGFDLNFYNDNYFDESEFV